MKNILFFFIIAFSFNLNAGNKDIFYYVADGNDRLYSYNRVTDAIVNIGPLGVGDVEGIAYYPIPGANVLYAANGGDLGTVSLTTGAYTRIGEIDGGGTANGAKGAITLNDVDGLMFDGRTFILWASNRSGSSSDVIFQIDITTGQFIPNAFGAGVDYIEINGSGADVDVDDIAISPLTGRMYATTNDGGSNDNLIEINKFTALFHLQTNLSEDDVEGIAFHNDGQLYGTEGDADRISEINLTTGLMTNFFNLIGGDNESIAAMVADANTVGGAVYYDNDKDGIRDVGETGVPNVQIYLYYDNDGDGILDPEDTRLQSTLTDVNGDYTFYYASTATLLVSTNPGTFPAAHALTTDNINSVTFADAVNFAELDVDNDFGIATGPDCDGDGYPNFYDAGLNSDVDILMDSCDIDSDNDGILDNIEGIGDFDGDGIPNYRDRDSDDDGIPDAIEANGGFPPPGYDASTGNIVGVDSDGNGMVDSRETFPGSGIMVSPVPDSDNDSYPDFLDLDSDNDGILDIVEAGGVDADQDGQNDVQTDANNNGYDDVLESTALPIPNTDAAYETTNGHTLKPNYIDLDSDGDGIDDTREGYSTSNYLFPLLLSDSDDDGIIDIWDISTFSSPITPFDKDGDGISDYIDLDSDNDNVSDFIEGNDANSDGVADVALSGNDSNNNGLDDAFDGGCGTDITLNRNDQAEEETSNGNMDLGSSDLELVTDGGDNQLVGLHYANFNVPQGQTIGAAYIQFQVDETSSGPITLTIQGQLIPNAPTFNSTDDNISDRTRTVASESWSPANWTSVGDAGPAQRTVDISSILQEIVNQPSWVANNDFVIIITGPTGNERTAETNPTITITLPGGALVCASNVAHQDFDLDGEDDFRDSDDDGDGIPTRSEIPDEDGNGTPDYLQDNSGACGFKKAPSSILLVSGNASSFSNNSGVGNAGNITGASDGNSAEFHDNNDRIVVDLSDTIPSGFDYVIRWAERTGESGIAAMTIEESIDGSTWLTHPSPPTTNSTSLINSTITANIDTRFLRITRTNPPSTSDFIVESITYTDIPICLPDADNDGVNDPEDIDDDNDGVLDTDEGCATYDATFVSQTGVGNHLDAYGVPDSNFAEWHTNGNIMVMDFGSVLPIGTQYYITWQRKPGATGESIMILEESTDNSSYSSHTLAPRLNTDDTVTVMVTAQNSFRYLRISKDDPPSVVDFEIDAIAINTCQDIDGDGIPNSNDLDSDNDGIQDIIEAGGVDVDNDGRSDNFDDTDGDGYTDTFDPDNGGTPLAVADTDGDGLTNVLDLDSDNDGAPDIIESGREDTNGDGKVDDIDGSNDLTNDDDENGWDNRYDQANGGNAISNKDSDKDGIADRLDLDSDNDGIPDVVELGGTDANGDGRADNFADSDNDGFNDRVDGDVGNDGTAENTANALIVTGNDANDDGIPDSYATGDFDGDNVPNYVDLDSDNDGIADVVEAGGTDVNGDGRADDFVDTDTDGLNDVLDGDVGNLLAVGSDVAGGNTSQALTLTGTDGNSDGAPDTFPNDDFDGDTRYNFQDLDSDDDGILDVTEAGGTDVNRNGQEDGFVDGDKDGFNDNVDGDPNNSLAAGSDATDTNLGNVTTATGDDTDNDGIPNSYPNDDFDGDGNYNFLDIDSDNDGITDNTEGQGTSSYIAPSNSDDDGDGIDNAYDSDDAAFGGVLSSFALSDIDDDNDPDSPDYLDLDSDNDGSNDAIEGHDTDGDGIADAGSPSNSGVSGGATDIDGDGLLDGFDNNTASKDPTNNNLQGTSHPNIGNAITTQRDWRESNDNDNDGVTDDIDVDDDNDGILDKDEASCDVPSIRFSSAPEAYWAFDNSTNDISGNGHNKNGGSTDPSFSTTAIQGTHSANFNGSSHVIRYSVDGGFMEQSYSEISFSAWIMPTTLSGSRVIYEEGGSGNGAVLWLDNAVPTFTTRSGGAGSETSIASSVALGDDGLWHHVAATFNSGVMIIYVDGIASTVTAGHATIPGHGDNGGVGGPNGAAPNGVTGYFQGLMDAARYSNSEAWTAGRVGFEAQKFCDTDNDGVADHLDLDSDNDGIQDIIEAGEEDSNADGIVDGTFTDTDGDGWSNEFDSDNGGTALDDLDSDNDGIKNRIDLDADNDGIADIIEAGGVDANNDGRADAPADTDGDGWANTFDSDQGGVVLPIVDLDGDGFENYLDIDTDNDGIIDNVEGQTTAAFLAPLGADTDNDGWDNRYDSDNGGTAITLSNFDGIAFPDYRDVDSDQDGQPDWIEGFNDDLDNDVLNDFISRANAFESAASNPGFYVSALDGDGDGIPNFLEDADLDGQPNFLDPQSTFYHDSDNDGLIDLYDADSFGSPSVLPNVDADAEPDWRDIDNALTLPISLLNFEAEKKVESVLLTWVTLSEINNDFFTIEKSVDGENFESVGIVDGSGNTVDEKRYQLVDPTPYNGVSYYRLKQTDFNGEFSYSDKRVVEFGVSLLFEETNIFPNPTNGDRLFTSMITSESGVLEVEIRSMEGGLISFKYFDLEGTNTSYEFEVLDGFDLSSGMYMLTYILNGERIESKPFIVK